MATVVSLAGCGGGNAKTTLGATDKVADNSVQAAADEGAKTDSKGIPTPAFTLKPGKVATKTRVTFEGRPVSLSGEHVDIIAEQVRKTSAGKYPFFASFCKTSKCSLTRSSTMRQSKKLRLG